MWRAMRFQPLLLRQAVRGRNTRRPLWRGCGTTPDSARSALLTLQRADPAVLASDPHLRASLLALHVAVTNHSRQQDGQEEVAQEEELAAITNRDLFLYGLQHGVPFICFGFVDNSIMLLAGDAIDATICVKFGFSTFAAAAMGNTVSNVFGLWGTNTIEAFLARQNLPMHKLTAGHLQMPVVAFTKMMGMVIGTVVGCILGMFPLIWPAEWRLWPADPVEEVRIARRSGRFED